MYGGIGEKGRPSGYPSQGVTKPLRQRNQGMYTPHVNAVGLTEFPSELTGTTAQRPIIQRVIAGFMLGVFLLVVVTTSVVSLGRYCLTSDGGDTDGLRTEAQH